MLNFAGVQRRFNELFKIRETLFFDDYAHHPTEIVEVLNSVKEVYKNKEIIVIFQPHRISRVNDLRREFSSSFKNCDSLVLCPIYSAGEKIKLKRKKTALQRFFCSFSLIFFKFCWTKIYKTWTK